MVHLSKQRKVSITVLGDGMTGKTSLINAFLGNKFTDKYTATASDVFQSSMIHYGERFDIKISDFAGERESEIISSLALQESDVIIVCYSIDDGESYESIRSFWAPQLQALKRRANLILVGLQSDKRSYSNSNDSMEFISEKEGRSLMREIKAEGFYECSAKNDTNIRSVFTAAVDTALKCRKKKMNFIKKAFGR